MILGWFKILINKLESVEKGFGLSKGFRTRAQFYFGATVKAKQAKRVGVDSERSWKKSSKLKFENFQTNFILRKKGVILKQ